MKALLIFLIALSVKYDAHAEIIFTVSKNACQASDSIKIDTTDQASIYRMMELPAGYTLISCDVIFFHLGEVFKTYYRRCDKGLSNQILSFWGRIKPKDQVSFENIMVLKDGKTMQLADKKIVIK